MKLWHFTCRDAAPRIVACGYLRPHPQIQLDGTKLVWLTDLENPTRDQIGLSSITLNCDRMEHRFEVDTDAMTPWLSWLRERPRDVRLAARRLALAEGALPAHWYVAVVNIPAVMS